MFLESYYLRFRYILEVFEAAFYYVYANGGTWEAHASLRHTNLTRWIDPRDQKGPQKP